VRGILEIQRHVPRDTREWNQVLERLNKAIQVSGERAVLGALTTIAERSGTDLDTILQYLSDGGRATDQRLMPMVNFGNVSSVQSIDPLTAVAGASTADITISAHTLHTDFGDISYNSGSILGLALNTRYYIYVQDPNNAGGAVTYIASTSKPNITANSGRYFVGTIVTPVAANSANIDNATSANPIVIRTTTAHGWSSGDNVQFVNLPGDFGTNLNGTMRTITVIDSDEFSIPVDGTAYAAYTSGGSATRIVDDGLPDWGGGGGGFLP
jgi:hypothetical protein